jgi:hypothetical protein
MDENQPMPTEPTVEAACDRRWTIERLFVVAGPPAVGKSTLIGRLASDELLRERLGAPKGAPRLDPRSAERCRPAALESLILHYDMLRPLNRQIPAYESDRVLRMLMDPAREITVLTLRAGADRLRAQLERRRTARPSRPPDRQAYLRTLGTLYEDDAFLAGWYGLWLDFVARYEAVTTGHFFVEVHKGYMLTPVNGSGQAATSFSRALAARPT